MRNNLFIIFLLIFSSTIISCGQSSKSLTDLSIEENELGLVFTKNKRVALENGVHKIDKESKVVKVSKRDSLTLEEFDILTSNVKSLYCQVKVDYSLTSQQLENIADLLEWIHSIKSYKDLVVIPETRSAIRDEAEKYDDKELENGNYKLEDFEKSVSANLEKYTDIESIDLKFYKK